MKTVRRLPELTTKAKIIVGLIVAFFVGLIGVFIALSVINGSLSGEDKIQDFTKKDTKSRKTEALGDATNALRAGNEEKAANIYESAIAAEPDGNRKVKLVIDQSRALYANGKLNEAIEAAKKGENYGTDKYLISDWLGQLYQLAKQNESAIAYYTTAGSLVESPNNDKGYDKKHYDDRVKALKAAK